MPCIASHCIASHLPAPDNLFLALREIPVTVQSALGMPGFRIEYSGIINVDQCLGEVQVVSKQDSPSSRDQAPKLAQLGESALNI